MKQQTKSKRNKPVPKVSPPRSRKLTAKEKELKKKMMNTARKFAKDPEKAICDKLGIGACWEF